MNTADGAVPISELEIGDEVLAFNEATGEVGTYAITAVHAHTDDEILYLVIDDELIVTTPDHPFYSDGEWVAAGDLVVGQAVMDVDGASGTVTALDVVIAPQTMYNLTQ